MSKPKLQETIKMNEVLFEKIISRMKDMEELYYRMLLIVAPTGGGKTFILQEIAKRMEAPILNLNLELSRRMLDFTEKQRILKLPRLLKEIIAQTGQRNIVLDNVEILFDVTLQQDPLKLLQKISRNATILVGWNGTTKNGYLYYAAPNHPEYRKYQIQDFGVIDIQALD